MEKRPLGKTGMSVTVLGYGGAEIGFENASQETVTQLLNAALDAGLNVIDTAECYPNSEKMIGEAVGARRSEYFLFTKCGHASGIDLPDWDPKLLEQHIDRSLRRLKTDRVDLVQLHSCDEAALRKGEVIEVLQRARDAGKTRFIGYSGDSTAAAYAVECGAFDTLQTSCNIADQESIELTLPKARARGMGVIIKRPVANAAWRTGKKPTEPYHHVYWDRLQELKYDFLAGDVGKAVMFALRFTLAQEGVSTAIVGTKNPERWAANAKALAEAGPLDAGQIAAIRARWKAVAHADWIGQI
jgi:aryl-alcohol dehydrogenase-like predicted oxidoreductase